jgi:hypothetical protein
MTKAKRTLTELGLIEDVRRVDATTRTTKYYIRVKFLICTTKQIRENTSKNV